MKAIFLSLLFFCINLHGYSQDFNSLKSIQFNNKSDFRNFETQIYSCAIYLFSVPVSENEKRKIASQALIQWMRGTPDFTFELNDAIISLAKKNKVLLNLYMAAMTKYVLENKDKTILQDEITYNSFLSLLNYCANPANNVKISRGLQKAIDAKNKDQLRRYLKL